LDKIGSLGDLSITSEHIAECRNAGQLIDLRILRPVGSQHLTSLMSQSHQSDAKTAESSGHTPISRSKLPYEHHGQDEERRSADLELGSGAAELIFDDYAVDARG
jgi:hypothetical protein